MIDENIFAIRGGTKFFPDSEPVEYNTMNEYFQQSNKAPNQMANMSKTLSKYSRLACISLPAGCSVYIEHPQTVVKQQL